MKWFSFSSIATFFHALLSLSSPHYLSWATSVTFWSLCYFIAQASQVGVFQASNKGPPVAASWGERSTLAQPLPTFVFRSPCGLLLFGSPHPESIPLE